MVFQSQKIGKLSQEQTRPLFDSNSSGHAKIQDLTPDALFLPLTY